METRRCRWCGKLFEPEKLEEHERECDMNDGGAGDMAYELIEQRYF